VPYVAAQVVAPADVNCCVAPRFKETDGGEMVCGFCTCRVTAAEAEPPGPVAVTVTELEDGMTEGAVYMPAELTLPAVALQPVEPAEVNCWVPPNFTVADVGAMVCGGGGPLATTCTLKDGPHSVPGFITWKVVLPAVPK